MSHTSHWRTVFDFWFPPGLKSANTATHYGMFEWWFGGGANAQLLPYAPVIDAARAGRLDAWSTDPRGRLSLILVLDQFTRGLFPGRPEAYAGDLDALRAAEEGLSNGHFAELAEPWEKTFFLLPLAHAEGPDHRQRLKRVVALTAAIADGCPPHLQPLYRHSANQARGHLGVICRFGRFPHRNLILGRTATPAEEAYVAKGDFIHLRQPGWRAAASRADGDQA